MTIRRDPTTKKLISIAGAEYAAFWIIVIGARLMFTYGANHWYNHAPSRWLLTNRITVDGLTDGLILLAIGMVFARVVRFANVLRTDTRAQTDAAATSVRIAGPRGAPRGSPP